MAREDVGQLDELREAQENFCARPTAWRMKQADHDASVFLQQYAALSPGTQGFPRVAFQPVVELVRKSPRLRFAQQLSSKAPLGLVQLAVCLS